MIWHIFKKDLRLLWRLALGLASVQCLETLLIYESDMGVPNLAQMFRVLDAITLLGGGLLIAAAVHQDAIPGVRQDWLVRPIRRVDLLAAKLLFVVLMVGLPVV